MIGHYTESNRKGFTLIELLVVIAIIALLSTLAVVSFSSARARARDAKRISDFSQLKTSLELVKTSTDEYPTHPTDFIVGKAAATDCLDTKGFVNAATALDCTKNAAMPQIQDDPQAPSQHYYYRAFQDDPPNTVCTAVAEKCEHYMISFELEGDTGSYKQGWNCTTDRFSSSKSVATAFPSTNRTGPAAFADCI